MFVTKEEETSIDKNVQNAKKGKIIQRHWSVFTHKNNFASEWKWYPIDFGCEIHRGGLSEYMWGRIAFFNTLAKKYYYACSG